MDESREWITSGIPLNTFSYEPTSEVSHEFLFILYISLPWVKL